METNLVTKLPYMHYSLCDILLKHPLHDSILSARASLLVSNEHTFLLCALQTVPLTTQICILCALLGTNSFILNAVDQRCTHGTACGGTGP